MRLFGPLSLKEAAEALLNHMMRSGEWGGTVGGLENRRPQMVYRDGAFHPSLGVWVQRDYVEISIDTPESSKTRYRLNMIYTGKDLVVKNANMTTWHSRWDHQEEARVHGGGVDSWKASETDVTSTWMENAELRERVDELRKVLRLKPLQTKPNTDRIIS